MLEEYLRLPLAKVVYFDGAELRYVVDCICYANGVNVSPDGQTIHVAGTTDLAIHLIDSDMAGSDLQFSGRIDTGIGIDNIDVDQDGALWLGHIQIY